MARPRYIHLAKQRALALAANKSLVGRHSKISNRPAVPRGEAVPAHAERAVQRRAGGYDMDPPARLSVSRRVKCSTQPVIERTCPVFIIRRARAAHHHQPTESDDGQARQQ